MTSSFTATVTVHAAYTKEAHKKKGKLIYIFPFLPSSLKATQESCENK